MANDCTFYTTITGDPEKIAKLSNKLGESGRLGLGDYDNFFDEPAPNDFEWGSKWIDFQTEYFEGSDTLIVQGDTAWQPISGLWQRISEKYDLFVETSYTEPGCGFAGHPNIAPDAPPGVKKHRQAPTHAQFALALSALAQVPARRTRSGACAVRETVRRARLAAIAP